MLLKALHTRVNEDALTLCNKPIIGEIGTGTGADGPVVSALGAWAINRHSRRNIQAACGPPHLDRANMLVKEYVGPEIKGFYPTGEPYMKVLRSIGKRKRIGQLVRRI